MMTIFESLILGIVQGLTEFLPISSSGHLVLLQNLFGISTSVIVFDVVVHWGTLFAVVAFFFKDFLALTRESMLFVLGIVSGHSPKSLLTRYPYAKLTFLIIVATLPAVTAALFLDDFIESLFHSLGSLALAWAVTGFFLILSRRWNDGARTLQQMTVKEAILIGIAQAIAITPGISRSGATIVASMACGFEKRDSARFSFFMAFPAIFGAGVLKFKEGAELFQSASGILWIGFLSAMVVGYFAIWVLLKMIQEKKFSYFGYYCLAMSLVTGGIIFFSGSGTP